MKILYQAKRKIKRYVEYQGRRLKRGIKHQERRLNKLGSRHKCYICKQTFDHFYPNRGGTKAKSSFMRELKMIGSDIDNFWCPVCSSYDRERHLFMFLDKLEFWNFFEGAIILHFAPRGEANLRQAILNFCPKEYIQADLFPENYPNREEIMKVDVTCIDFPDDYFDFIICNHVLEHVLEDEKAMSELFRVLKSEKYAILQTPFSSVLSNSFTDPNINTDELRLRFHGQEDHVRVFGQDLFDKLEKAGFHLMLKRSKDYFSPEESFYYGVNHLEDLILVSK